MKKRIYKKIWKEKGVLLTVFVLLVSTVMMTATKQSLGRIKLSGEDTHWLSQSNMFDSDWIHYDEDGWNVDALGLVDGGTFEWAIRITSDELVGYDGYELTVVRWHYGFSGGSSPPISGVITIYNEETSTRPGEVITSEPFTIPSEGWYDIPLSTHVPIDVSKDVWVSVRVTHAIGEFPAGVGLGPVVPGKGGWLTIDEGVTWEQLGIDYETLDYNWNIWVKVEEPLVNLEIRDISGGLFMTNAVIKNTGSSTAINIMWDITLSGGFILRGKETTGVILGLSSGEERTISSGVILGFGNTLITVTATCAGSVDTAEREAFVLLFLLRLKNDNMRAESRWNEQKK